MAKNKYLSWLSRKAKKKVKSPKPHNELTTQQLIRRYLISKLPKLKESAIRQEASLIDSLPQNKVNHIAVVLDGRVEEVIRAQNRLAALLLSEPAFVEFDPTKERIAVGLTEYKEGEFITPEPPAHDHVEEDAGFGFEGKNLLEEK